MEPKIIYFIVAEENTNKIYKHNFLLIKDLSKKFDYIYILNLFNLRLFSKKKFKFEEKINEKLYVINFNDNSEFKNFAQKKKDSCNIYNG